MKKFEEEELTFEELVNKINLTEYVQYVGYSYDKKKSSKTQKVFKKREGGKTADAIIIMNGKTGEFYSNASLPEDTGNLINFVMNRLYTFVSKNNSKSDYCRVSQILNEYLGIPVEDKQKKFVKVEIDKDVERKPFNLHLHNARKLSDMSFFRSRRIAEETIKHPLFEDRIFQVNDYNHEKEKTLPYLNTGFPLYSKGKIVGVEMRNASGFRKYGEFSNKIDSVWLSKKPVKVGSFCVAESPVDAISHFQIKKPENVMYCSSGGNLGRNQVTEIIRNAEEAGAKNITSITDNDIYGRFYDFQIIQALDINNKISLLRKNPLELEFKVAPGVDEGKMRSFLNFLQRYNNQQKELLKGFSGDPGKSNSYQHIFKGARKSDGSYIIKVPNVNSALQLFNERLTKLLDLKMKFNVDKSIRKDWNQDLMEGVHQGKEQKKKPKHRIG